MAQKFVFNPFTATLDVIDLAPGATDELVKVSANDTTAGLLNGKLTSGTNITLTENNDGANEDLEISAPNLANDTLSNLTSPVELNQTLQTPLASDLQLATVNNGAGDSDNITLSIGTATGTRGTIDLNTEVLNLFDNAPVFFDASQTSSFWGGDVYGLFINGQSTEIQNQQVFFIATQDSALASPAGEEIVVKTGDFTNASASGTTGLFEWRTGDVNGVTSTANTGQIFINTGDQNGGAGSSGSTGLIEIKTGSVLGGSGNAGSIDIITGATTGSGNSGNLKLETGTAGGTRGKIKFVDGSEGTIGHIWTSTDTLGNGNWAILSAADRDLGNLTNPTAINQDLLPDSAFGRDLGNATNGWSILWVRDIVQPLSTGNLGIKTINSPLPTGDVNTTTGNNTASSGSIPSGDYNISTGNLTNAANSGDSGDINLTPGTVAGAGSRGTINLKDGTEGTSGDVWTSTDILGSGAWVTPTGETTWTKYTVTHTALQTAATTNDIELFSLAAMGIIHEVIVKHGTAFAGTGITDYTISIGITGTLDKYATAFDVDQAVSDTTFQISSANNMENFGSATSIRIAAVSTGADLDQSTAGSVDVWVRTSALP